MFLENSRYAALATDVLTSEDGRTVSAVRLRRLPFRAAQSYQTLDIDQLDILAHRHYGDGTRFWHIADANTELQANDLMGTAARNIALPNS